MNKPGPLPCSPSRCGVVDSNQDGQDDPADDDARGQGAPSAEPTASNLIGSGMVERVHASGADQFTTAAPLGSSQPRLVLVPKRKQLVPSDQVTTELLPHHVPRSPLGLVAVKLIFGCLFEAFQRPSQAARTDTSTGADTQRTKSLMPRYVTILICTLLFVNLSCILMIYLSVGNLHQLIHRRILPSQQPLHMLPRSLLLRE
jgi:hypothetical protein